MTFHRVLLPLFLLISPYSCFGTLQGANEDTSSGCDRTYQDKSNNTQTRLKRLSEERLALMFDVARWKWNEKKEVTDPTREKELLEKLVKQGEALGIPPNSTRDFFIAQFESSRNLQESYFAEWRETNQGYFENVPDLGSVQRPKIEDVSQNMLQALAESIAPN